MLFLSIETKHTRPTFFYREKIHTKLTFFYRQKNHSKHTHATDIFSIDRKPFKSYTRKLHFLSIETITRDSHVFFIDRRYTRDWHFSIDRKSFRAYTRDGPFSYRQKKHTHETHIALSIEKSFKAHTRDRHFPIDKKSFKAYTRD